MRNAEQHDAEDGDLSQPHRSQSWLHATAKPASWGQRYERSVSSCSVARVRRPIVLEHVCNTSKGGGQSRKRHGAAKLLLRRARAQEAEGARPNMVTNDSKEQSGPHFADAGTRRHVLRRISLRGMSTD